ncbi:MAG: putative metal-binding motif-containing protein [Myxococcales bacterium]|nr:putative metal-binding motif-containing protein [Myxococcales bacterium]
MRWKSVVGVVAVLFGLMGCKSSLPENPCGELVREGGSCVCPEGSTLVADWVCEFEDGRRVSGPGADGGPAPDAGSGTDDAGVDAFVAECEADFECDDGDVCNGVERCDAGRCVAGAPLVCDDGDNCTVDSCDPEVGCRNVLIDEDRDGFAPAHLGTCATRPGASRDCDDTNPNVYPGAPEQCDGLDNDCDGIVDNNVERFDCFRDADGDGYPSSSDRVVDCRCPSGFIPRRADGLFDCADNEPGAHPGSDEFRAIPYSTPTGPSFDWNCDGVQERQNPRASSGCVSSGDSCSGGGWSDSVPACGAMGTLCGCLAPRPPYYLCTPLCLTDRVQQCR